MTTFTRIEKCLLPPPEIVDWNKGNPILKKSALDQKIAHYVKNIFILLTLIAIAPITLIYDWAARRKAEPLKRAPDIQLASPSWPPREHGFAMSFFQSSGLGTKWSATPGLEGRCDWDKWMDNRKHVNHPENDSYEKFYTDILTNPARHIEMLKEQNVNAYRFSLEWSVIEPRRGEIDYTAVGLYHNFIQKLLEAEITPSITLSHFVVPEWFYESGNFQKMENIDRYLDYAMRAINLFPDVKEWWSFNELGVKAFQQTREVYPTDIPEGSSLSKRVHTAGNATLNMLLAHCKLHEKVKELHPEVTLGVTHQWLKFDMASGNFLEKIFRHYFEKFAFRPIFEFFKEGKFSFQFPFMANIQFEMPKEAFEENEHYLMKLGIQAYPAAEIKMGLNFGKKYPTAPGSFQNSLFTFGGIADKGEALMRFGPRWNVLRMKEFLAEAFSIAKRVSITEFGSDAAIKKWGSTEFEFDEEAQGEYLKDLVETIKEYCLETGHELEGIHAWSDLNQQQEWELGLACRLGMIKPILDENRQMTDWEETPASLYLKEAFREAEPNAEEQLA